MGWSAPGLEGCRGAPQPPASPPPDPGAPRPRPVMTGSRRPGRFGVSPAGALYPRVRPGRGSPVIFLPYDGRGMASDKVLGELFLEYRLG
jgi:hypothetical protein